MQPSFVVPEQPRNGFVLGLAPAHEALPLQAIDLQRAEQGLAAGIDAPMSNTQRCVFKVSQYQRIQLMSNVAFEAPVDLLFRQALADTVTVECGNLGFRTNRQEVFPVMTETSTPDGDRATRIVDADRKLTHL